MTLRVLPRVKKAVGHRRIATEVFWTDSRAVLGSIANDVKGFHIFVPNRVQEIQEKSAVKQ